MKSLVNYNDIQPVDSMGAVVYTKQEVMYNTKVKHYPTGDVKVTFCSSHIFKEKGLECVNPKVRDNSSDSDSKNDEKNFKDSVMRSRNKVFDIFLLNEWDYFFTGTLSDDCGFDRYNVDEVCHFVNQKLYYFVKRDIVLRYIFVPEFHKDGAVHYHGFIKFGDKFQSDSLIPAVNPHTGKYITFGRGGSRNLVFNWLNWTFGYTTLVKTYGNPLNAAKYICKYVTKSDCQPMKHRYYCGGLVVREPECTYYSVAFEVVPLKTFSNDFSDYKFFTGSSLEFSDILITVLDTVSCRGGDYHV